ncbi:MBL fold metallo-hydrolase [Oceanobacter sp. 4_MG-2023]|uniref:MBL fold metallo-hydrolase n=1 Tax=Oceanobacter sp. 4_MG-2023 TaxID=3062623 RepID=UPI002737214F|nr:MBL fold metallo-hydrolase [Oceanobacter sp. 4_MG-2023]MDP2546290.1 MBL fold metallo-hydrolase [Oceanobacter sp. 4_MG-2023]
MRYISLGSGSKGNATLLEHQGRSLLIDCGFSRKTLLQRIESAQADAGQLEAVLVTHEHGDHAKGVMAVCELLDIPLYCSQGTAIHMGWIDHPRWKPLTGGDLASVAGMSVAAVTVPHDAREPLQFVVEAAGLKVGVLSDLGSLTPHVVAAYQGCHGLQLEANHDPDMLRKGPYPPRLQARVAGPYGHLSNAQCAELIQRIDWPGVQHLTAGHISEKNNHPDLVGQALAVIPGLSDRPVRLLAQNRVADWCEF